MTHLPRKRNFSSESLLISVVVCVYNDWGPLRNCLDGLASQCDAPNFEVVVIDDGSESAQPESWDLKAFPFPVRIFRQTHAGLPAARNSGILLATGSVVLFTDADCILEPDCLRNLHSEIENNRGSNFFQLSLTGDSSHLVGRAEHLHLTTVQAHKLRRNGQILYLNTSGFALCRSKAVADGLIFDPRAVRAEDTLLLWKLVQYGELPHFTGSAGVLHNVRLSVPKYLWKGLRTGYQEGAAFGIVGTRDVGVRLNWSERVQLLSSMWRQAEARKWSVMPVLIVLIRQLLSFMGSFSYRCIKWHRHPERANG